MTTTAPHVPTLADPGDHAADVAAIEALIADVAVGVSTQDPDRCVARFAADARSVIATGTRGVGRDAIRQAHVTAFASASIPTRARFPVLDILFVRPDVAVVTTGAYPAGPDEDIDPVALDAPPTIITWTLVRQEGADDGWWIAARQFTKAAA